MLIKCLLNSSAIEVGLVKEIFLAVIKLGFPELEFADNMMRSNCQALFGILLNSFSLLQ